MAYTWSFKEMLKDKYIIHFSKYALGTDDKDFKLDTIVVSFIMIWEIKMKKKIN